MTQLEVWEKLSEAAHYNAHQLAKLCHVSLRTLQRQFRVCLGQSPQQWLEARRHLAAEQMLQQGVPIKQVIAALEYKHSSHFYRRFKQQASMTPSQFVASKPRPPSPPLPDFPRDFSI